jgi:hypothetical protein
LVESKQFRKLNKEYEMKNSLIAALLIGAAAIPAAANAQAASAGGAAAASAPSASLSVGSKVVDPQGQEVGTISAISGDNIVLDTGTAKATLARSSFGSGPNGPTVGITKAQLEAAVQKANAQASTATDSALQPGAAVRSKDGQSIGKIASVSGNNVVVDRAGGPVTLNKANFTADQQGPVVSMTAAEFESAARAATGGAKTSG